MSALQKEKITQIKSSYVDHELKKQQYKQKRRRGLIRRLIAFTIVAAGALLIMANVIHSQTSSIAEKNAHNEELKITKEALLAKKQSLQEEITHLQDEEYVLDIARRDYFYSKEGEIIFKRSSESPSY
ncbi:cell division protein DIVIC [Bacillaceae bacterium SIJ1]|uniref:FtsB family cell division protein n=1 Tax=Litoribacterium kuwaitense TaxID=1398745 RepID=UPI0013EC7684|nr:septum formation initiator family protein [Litoribacterium kuwaitense]NGP45809.1 cell division protein DIVIC [Litoribacterium kuwaitense]